MQRPQNDRHEVDRAHFPSQKETNAVNESIKAAYTRDKYRGVALIILITRG